jgi:LmbE family N-acetylglucosaminyl deacetylase
MRAEVPYGVRWLKEHPTWIPFALPHFTIKEDAFYFLISHHPFLEPAKPLAAMFHRVNGRATVGELMQGTGAIQALATLWEQGIIHMAPQPSSLQGSKILVVEPHPDDAALSVGGALLLERTNSAKTILSVCSRSNSTSYMALGRDYFDASTITELRHQESLLAAKFLNATYHNLGQPDIPLRYIDADRYTLENLAEVRAAAGGYMHMPPPNSLIEEVAALLWTTVQPIEPDEIWFPVGVGNHFDHRLTRDACLHMIATHWDVLSSKQLLLYEDLPYAWEDPQSAYKLTDLLSRHGAKIERTPVDITSVFEEKINCLKIYASQWKVSALRPKIEECARQALADRRGYGESLWKLREPPRSPLPPLVTVKGMAQDRLETALGLLSKRRLRIRRLSILIAHAVGQWADHAASLLRLFPSATIDVLAFHQHKAQFESFMHPRLQLAFFHEQPSSLVFHVLKWSCHLNQTALIFGGPRRIQMAKWLRRVLPTQHAYAFETFEDFCALLHHSPSARAKGERGN